MCECEVLAQNTPQIIFYSMLNLSFFKGEQKRSVFVCVPLNANELQLPRRGRSFKSRLPHADSLKMSETVQPFIFRPESDNDGETQEELTTLQVTIV